MLFLPILCKKCNTAYFIAGLICPFFVTYVLMPYKAAETDSESSHRNRIVPSQELETKMHLNHEALSSKTTWNILEDLHSHHKLNLSFAELESVNLFTAEELFQDVDIPADEFGMVVPNIVHYIRFGSKRMSFVEMTCLKSAWKNIRPSHLYVHCEEPPFGEYWDEVKDLPGIELKHRKRPKSVMGNAIEVIEHAADVARLQVLMEYGGIYLDNDVYVVKSFEPLRKYGFSIGWPNHMYIGNQVMVASKHSRFLQLYYRTYLYLNDSAWYFNGGELPTKQILYKNPSLVHRERLKLGVHPSLMYFTLIKQHRWERFYSIHLFYRQFLLEQDGPFEEYNLENIKQLNTSFGEMARLVHYGSIEKL